MVLVVWHSLVPFPGGEDPTKAVLADWPWAVVLLPAATDPWLLNSHGTIHNLFVKVDGTPLTMS